MVRRSKSPLPEPARGTDRTGEDSARQRVTEAAESNRSAMPIPAPLDSTPRRLARSIGRYWLLVSLVVVWQLVTSADRDLQRTLPPPTKVFAAGWELWQAGILQQDILASLQRVGVALLIAVVVGLPLGAALGRSERFAWSVSPIVEFLRPIPPIAWIPLSILWFGIGDLQNQFIIFVAAVFPIIINTAAGVQGVDRQLIRAARSLGAGRLTLVGTVILPAALPSVFVGFRVGTGIAWMALVAGELVAATKGLGYLISQGRSVFRSDYIVVGMLVIGLIGLALNAVLLGLERIIAPWSTGDDR